MFPDMPDNQVILITDFHRIIDGLCDAGKSLFLLKCHALLQEILAFKMVYHQIIKIKNNQAEAIGASLVLARHVSDPFTDLQFPVRRIVKYPVVDLVGPASAAAEGGLPDGCLHLVQAPYQFRHYFTPVQALTIRPMPCDSSHCRNSVSRIGLYIFLVSFALSVSPAS